MPYSQPYIIYTNELYPNIIYIYHRCPYHVIYHMAYYNGIGEGGIFMGNGVTISTSKIFLNYTKQL